MNNNLTFEDALSLTEQISTPVPWLKHNLTILRDGYLDCGTRIHVVEEQDYHTPQMIGNAIIISEDLELRGK